MTNPIRSSLRNTPVPVLDRPSPVGARSLGSCRQAHARLALGAALAMVLAQGAGGRTALADAPPALTAAAGGSAPLKVAFAYVGPVGATWAAVAF